MEDYKYQETLWDKNRGDVQEDNSWQDSILELRELEKFVRDFSFLSFGRNYVECGDMLFSLQGIMNSAEITMGNIISCCESASIADANALLRKLNDDLLFYVYITIYNSYNLGAIGCANETENLSKEIRKRKKSMEKQIHLWCDNQMKDLNIGAIWDQIEIAPCLSSFVQNYNLRKSNMRTELDERLNGYMHGDGIALYNKPFFACKYANDDAAIRQITGDAKYVLVVFLLLLILCSPLSIMSTEYIDFLDVGLTPPKNSQYWVAPFVEKFVKENISMIDESWLVFLRRVTMMRI